MHPHTARLLAPRSARRALRLSRGARRVLLGLATAALWATACTDPDSPSAPCELDCGAHGTCVIRQGRETCACVLGHTGADCADCAAGFVVQAGACVADPCEPNPCAAPHQGVCSVTDTGVGCGCDADAQDNDGDGACRPTCAAASVGFGPQACDDSSGEPLFSGPRSCQVQVTYAPESGVASTVYLRGEFNAWDLSTPLTRDAEGRFNAVLTTSPGDYGYKFFVPEGEQWLEDPVNPYFKWVGGERNSRLRVPDCNVPLLRLVYRPSMEEGRVRFKVQYVDGALGAGLGEGGVAVVRNGVAVTGALEAATGVLTIDDPGLPRGKYVYHVTAADGAGRSARRLYVPVWVEDAAFDWRDAVLYFALTDRFADGNPGNNAPVAGLPPLANWQGGDFAGLRAKIDSGYFEAMGVNAIWISSISMNTQGASMGDRNIQYAGYHSYWPISTGWTADTPLAGVQPVDPHFGSLQEFKGLVEAAHARGIRVLVDLVANHVHSDSPLWTQHQADAEPWFHLPAAGCKETHWEQPITCWFAGYLPDFEYKNTAVMESVVEHAAWLVEETGIDGFRLDAVKHMIDDAVYGIRGRLEERLRTTGEQLYLVGETFTGEDGADQLKHYLGPRLLDGQFDFPLYWQVLSVFLREERDLRALEGMVGWNDGLYGDAVMSTFLGNHDVCRAASHAAGDIGDLWCNGGKDQAWDAPPGQPSGAAPYRKLRSAWTFLFTSPGVPLVYYGDEIGLAGSGDPDNRRMMQFDGLSAEQQATLAHVRLLGATRAAHPALRRGTRRTLHLGDDGLSWAYAMVLGEDAVVAVFNRGEAARTVPLDLSELGWRELGGVTDALTGATLPVENGQVEVVLDGRNSAVLVAQ